ncbi:endonuclease [Luteimonas soli]|uniref:Endonuclease n=1 Tax=Luteimonas soli TaxID=1648966 RepID=A0ABV7XL83_9GAMM
MALAHLRLARLLAGTLLLACGSAPAAVFVNELHYDNAGGDSGERIEIVATDGESLAGYRIHLYSGGSSPGSAGTYGSAAVPGGSTTSCGGSVRIATVVRSGLQNGPNDAIALVDASGQVVQFLGYEGSVTAASGPAAGLTSDSLPVAENGSTPAGTSLQLRGSGSGYDDFSWAGSSADSFGACNDGQSFSGGNPAPILVSTTPADGATGFPAAGDLEVVFNEVVSAANGAFALTCDVSGNVPLTHPASGAGFVLSTNTALHGGEHCVLSIDAAKLTDAGGAHPGTGASIGFDVAKGGGGDGDDDYYSRVNASSPGQLRCSLHETIRGHTVYPYSGSGTSTWTILEIADEDPDNAGRVIDAYRNRSYAKGSDRAGTGSGLTYNREHTWPNSLGFGSRTGDRGLPNAPYTDTHMLYLADTGYNSDRGNKPNADCPASANCGARATEANGGRGGGSGAGDSNWVKGPDGNGGSFEPWDARKGDMARAVMYMAIRYEGGQDAATGQSEPDLELTDNRSLIVKTSGSPAYMGLLSTLLAWHQADPPDAAEAARNEVVYSFQGNRNPFIDHPEWATQALFESSSPATCQLN